MQDGATICPNDGCVAVEARRSACTDTSQADNLAGIAARAACVADALTASHGQRIREAAHDAARMLTIAMAHLPYHAVPRNVLAMARSLDGFTPLLFAVLMSRLVARATSMNLPDAIRRELAIEAARILDDPPMTLDADEAIKDLSICLGRSLPCVAQIVEDTGALPRAAALRRGPGRLALGRELLRTGLRGAPYLEIHTHTPMLGGFTEAGWERCYALVAAILRARPNLRGMTGGSWFYDPAVAAISPRLAYLAETPLSHGAFRVRLDASQADYDLATATSPTRRALALEGRYQPEKWQLIWPRAALLAWARGRARP